MSSGTAGSDLRAAPNWSGTPLGLCIVTLTSSRHLGRLPCLALFLWAWGNKEGRADGQSEQQLYPQMLMKNILIHNFPVTCLSSGNLALWQKAKNKTKICTVFMLTSQLAIIPHFQFWICLQVDIGDGLPSWANFQSLWMCGFVSAILFVYHYIMFVLYFTVWYNTASLLGIQNSWTCAST